MKAVTIWRAGKCFPAPSRARLRRMTAAAAGLLAAQGIPIFAVSTFNTDYVLVKEADFDRALACLAEAGCRTA